MISQSQHLANLVKLSKAMEELVFFPQNELRRLILFYETSKKTTEMFGTTFVEHYCNANEFKFVILQDAHQKYHQPYFLV